jgi:uncharacterized protein with PIN domain
MTKEQDFVINHTRVEFPENIEYSCYQFPMEKGMKQRCCECGGQFEEIFVFNRQSKTPLFPSLRKFLCKNCKDDYWKKVEMK